MLKRPEFLKHLRNDLNHLYDPVHLQRSPLAELLGLSSRPDSASALQQALIQAIESLKPGDDASYSRAWEIYETLLYRYVEQMSPRALADQLAISARHLRRKQQEALGVLADRLCQEYQLGENPAGPGASVSFRQKSEPGSSPMDKELAWLKDSSSHSSTELSEVLSTVVQFAQGLAERYQVRLETATPGTFPSLLIHPVALRQILLNLLSTAIPRNSGGRVQLTARHLRHAVQLRIQCEKPSAESAPAFDEETANLKKIQQLAELSGSRLVFSLDPSSCSATLSVPARQQINVLVIDDNADTLQMLKRYTSATRYQLITTRDPGQAISLAEKSSPEIIVLDVMMPQMDGWQVLQQLRQNPATAAARIIVCSILGQGDFAYFMGADGVLAKPVTPQDFLAALDQQTALMERESH